LSLVEIRDRLIEKGWHKVTIAQIKCAMANIREGKTGRCSLAQMFSL
jgi:hypothetical protein